MRMTKRIAFFVIIVLLLSVFGTWFQIIFDLDARRKMMLDFTRLSVKDAIINIQTTEQTGYNYTTNSDIKEKYAEYLDALKSEANRLNDTDSLELFQKFQNFLYENNNKSTEGDALFRPIQFGMTYLDTELFKQSLADSIQTLIDTNFTDTFSGSVQDAVRVKTDPGKQNADYGDGFEKIQDYNIAVKISGPKLCSFGSEYVKKDPDTLDFYRTLYGINYIQDYIRNIEKAQSSDSSGDLGISFESVPNFYIYYDIEVKVNWYSCTANPLLREYFMNTYYGVPEKLFSSKNEHLELPMETNYSYRYVLLN